VPTYETLFITPPNLAVEEESTTIEVLTKVVSDGGGSVTVAERMGRRRLAYPIGGFDEGIYIRLLYDSGVDVPKELERRIRLSDNVLRGLTVRLEEDWAEHAKEQAVRDAQRRAEAEAAAAMAAAAEAERAAADEEKPAGAEENAKSEEAAEQGAEAVEEAAAEAGDEQQAAVVDERPSEVEEGEDAEESKP
jgi:small subunit ribosomal protein S6